MFVAIIIIDGSVKRKPWLDFQLKSSHVIERRSSVMRVSMGLSVWRETSKKLTVCREKGKKLTVCRELFLFR